MNDRQHYLHAVLDVLKAENHLPGDFVGTAQTPLSDGGAELTSLDLIRVLVTLEEQLSIEIDDSAIMNANFATVGDLVEVVDKSVRVEVTVGGEPGDDSP